MRGGREVVIFWHVLFFWAHNSVVLLGLPGGGGGAIPYRGRMRAGRRILLERSRI